MFQKKNSITGDPVLFHTLGNVANMFSNTLGDLANEKY